LNKQLFKTAEETARLEAIWAELEAHKDELEEPKQEQHPQAEIDEENRKAKIRRLSSLERKELLGNVKSIAGNDGFKTKWERILSQFILNNIAPMNEEINLLRNFAQGVSQRLEKAERSAREQDNHHYYKIFADGVKTLLEAL
jgi:hypothetical protein